MQRHLPILKGWLDLPTSNILEDILCGSPLCVFGVENLTMLINLDDVREDGVNLLKCARLAEDGRVINALKQRKSNCAVGNPKRKMKEQPPLAPARC